MFDLAFPYFDHFHHRLHNHVSTKYGDHSKCGMMDRFLCNCWLVHCRALGLHIPSRIQNRLRHNIPRTIFQIVLECLQGIRKMESSDLPYHKHRPCIRARPIGSAANSNQQWCCTDTAQATQPCMAVDSRHWHNNFPHHPKQDSNRLLTLARNLRYTLYHGGERHFHLHKDLGWE